MRPIFRPMLNEPQTRRLSVRLGAVASGARDLIERIDRAGSASGEGTGVLPVLRSELETLVELVQLASAELGLAIERPAPDLGHEIDTWAATAWVTLIDCLPENLAGTGRVEPEIAPVLSEAVTRLTRQLERIRSLGE